MKLNAISRVGAKDKVMIGYTDDTICAISTPSGVGGIAVVRISGSRAIEIADKIWRGKAIMSMASHTVHLGQIIDGEGSVLDQAVVAIYRAPNSFTGEDVVEFSVHGSIYIQQALLASLISKGARLAKPGEFTRRAFASGKFDLAQAEAVADLIASESKASHRIAMNQMRGNFSNRLKSLRDNLLQLISLLELELDFSDQEVEFASRQELLKIATTVKEEVTKLAKSFKAGKAIKDGIPVAIIGPTNAGKSSLLNALLEDDRAIVSDIHGTTRDVIEDTLSLGDYKFRIMDTAGIRHTDDTIEALGITRSLKAASSADIVLSVIDITDPKESEVAKGDAKVLKIYNKLDKIQSTTSLPNDGIIISAKTGEGLDKLKESMLAIAKEAETAHCSVLVTNARHLEALLNANESITRAIDALNAQLSGELVAQDLRLTIHHLSSILGEISSDEVLGNIFSRFCIGK